MKKIFIFSILFCSVILLMTCLNDLFAAEDYPTKPVNLVVPWAPGGHTDTDARIWASYAEKILGEPIVIVNKPGSAGVLGTSFAAKAKPDGYTLLQATPGTNVIAEQIQKVDYNLESFVEIARFTASSAGLLVNSESPWKTLDDFIKDAKGNPGNMTTSGMGASSYTTLATKNWEKQAGIKLKHVHFQGGAPALMSLLGKHVDIHFNYPQVFISHVKGGKLRLLVVAAPFQEFPNIPTFKQLGYKGNFLGWSALMAPKGTPNYIIKKLSDITEKQIMKDENFLNAVKKTGAAPFFMGPMELKQFVREEYDNFRKLIAEEGLTVKEK